MEATLAMLTWIGDSDPSGVIDQIRFDVRPGRVALREIVYGGANATNGPHDQYGHKNLIEEHVD